MSLIRTFRNLGAIAGVFSFITACGQVETGETVKPVKLVEKTITLKYLQDACKSARDTAVQKMHTYSYQKDKLSDTIGSAVASGIATNSTEFEDWTRAERNYEFWCQKITPATKVSEDQDGYIEIKHLAPGKPLESDLEIGRRIIDNIGNQYQVVERFDSLHKVSDGQSTKLMYRYEFTALAATEKAKRGEAEKASGVKEAAQAVELPRKPINTSSKRKADPFEALFKENNR